MSAEAILEVVDRQRDGAWTMASVAAELGVSEPAIYYHFPSKQALVGALGARVLEQLPLPGPTDDWEQWLGELARGALEFCRSHPFLADVDMRLIATEQAASVRVLDEVLRYLGAYGFTPEDAVLAIASVMVVVHMFAFPSFDPDEHRPRLSALAQTAGATLAEDVYAGDPYWDLDKAFSRMLRVALAGIRAELAPRGRRRAQR